MPITATDIQFRLSGGAGNSNVNLSIGGAKSTTQLTDNTLHNLFDQISGAERAAGDIEYRCLYVHNAHASLTWESVKTWIGTNTPDTESTIDIGLDPAGVNGTAATPADESTAPAGVTFTAPASFAAGLTIGNVPFSQHQAIWVRRTITASSTPFDNDSVVLQVQGDTAA
jgi:hypothetical protein